MFPIPDALDLFLEYPTPANLLWATPALFKAIILVEFEDATERILNIRPLCLIRVLPTALMMVAAVLGVFLLNRTLFLMMMVAASAVGFGVLVVGIWVLVLGYVAMGYVAMARDLIYVKVRRGFEMIGFLLILFHQRSEESEESKTIIKEYRIVRKEGQERSNDSTEERTENLPHYDRRRISDSTEESETPLHNNHRRSSAVAEQRVAQIASDTLREERSEMKARMMRMEAQLQ